MDIKDWYIGRKATCDTQDSLEEKIDRLMSMMGKLIAQDDDQITSLSQRYIRAKEEDKQEISMIEIMIRETNIGQIVKIVEYHLVVEYNMDRMTETDQGIIKIIEVISEEEILGGICNQIRILEVRIIVVDIEGIIEMIIMKEVEVGLGIGNIQIIPEGMIGVTVGLGQVQEQALTEIGLNVINVENMIILLRITQFKSGKGIRGNTTNV